MDASIDGRTIDDIVDYLTYTFVPLLLMWRMGWLPQPAVLWIAPALVASLFGFANTAAKDETAGFFLAFPPTGTWSRSTPVSSTSSMAHG